MGLSIYIADPQPYSAASTEGQCAAWGVGTWKVICTKQSAGHRLVLTQRTVPFAYALSGMCFLLE